MHARQRNHSCIRYYIVPIINRLNQNTFVATGIFHDKIHLCKQIINGVSRWHWHQYRFWPGKPYIQNFIPNTIIKTRGTPCIFKIPQPPWWNTWWNNALWQLAHACHAIDWNLWLFSNIYKSDTNVPPLSILVPGLIYRNQRQRRHLVFSNTYKRHKFG